MPEPVPLHRLRAHPSRTHQEQEQPGFTLIEVMITVAIAGILLMVAYPSYLQYLTDSRRTDARNALLAFSTSMERYRSDHNSYDNAHSGTGYPNPPKTHVFPSQTPIDTLDKFYNLSLQGADNSGYTLRATPITGTGQDGDGYLELTSIGIKRWDKDDNGTIGTDESTWNP
ncbi:MAG: type IV pilus assembly protein PilE [Motiliproteus sp.]|jgi:type IV pilus assembly protein PilE